MNRDGLIQPWLGDVIERPWRDKRTREIDRDEEAHL